MLWALQLPVLSSKVPRGDGWIYEIKYDGYRIVAEHRKGDVALTSRRGMDFTRRLPSIANAVRGLSCSVVLDGEAAYVAEEGRTDIHAFHRVLGGEGDPSRVVYFVFDLLWLDGRDLRALPLLSRKALLDELLRHQGLPLRLVEFFKNDGAALFDQAARLGLEGIVAKRGEGPYRGARSSEWVKVKCQKRGRFVIVGYTPRAGSKTGFGALLLAEQDARGMRYVGKVGTGFSDAVLDHVGGLLAGLAKPSPALQRAPPLPNVRWVRPELICEVRFADRTDEGILWHASFEKLVSGLP